MIFLKYHMKKEK